MSERNEAQKAIDKRYTKHGWLKNADYLALELQLEKANKELEWFRTLELIRDDGGETATKLHELWEMAESAKDVISFYGDADHHVKFLSERITPIRADKGKRARKWLEG